MASVALDEVLPPPELPPPVPLLPEPEVLPEPSPDEPELLLDGAGLESAPPQLATASAVHARQHNGSVRSNRIAHLTSGTGIAGILGLAAA